MWPLRSLVKPLLAFSLVSLWATDGVRAQDATGPADELAPLAAQGNKRKFRKDQEWPIKLATSGGNIHDSTAGFCCAGTLGALVEKNGNHFILSNNHVLARSNLAKRGEAIIQPGLVDLRPACAVPDGDEDTVALLSRRKKIRFGGSKNNSVDAAIARVVPGAVNPDGRVMKIGVPGESPVEAEVGMGVKKSARTTGLTRGSIVTVNLSSNVEFEPECESGITKIARFVNMIAIVSANDRPFSKGGDSGAMVFEDVDECPRPVGLLFAGNDDVSVANPATIVQRAISNLKPRGEMSFVGCTSVIATAGSSRRAAPLLEDLQVREARQAMREREQQVLAIPGVHGIGVGLTVSGAVGPAIHIYVSKDDRETLDRIPETMDGYRTEIFLTEPFVARTGCVRAD